MARVYKFDLRTRRISTLKGGTQVVHSSRPYPLFTVDAMNVAGGMTRGFVMGIYADSMDVSAGAVAGSLRMPLQTYPNWPPESLDVAAGATAGDLRLVLKSYGLWPPESLDVAASCQSGVLKLVLLTYPNWPPESLNVSAGCVSGVLT